MKQIFVIEHLEPRLWKWCLIEYKHISRIVGKRNLWFTNLKSPYIRKLKNYGECFEKSVKNLELGSACVLDPEARRILRVKEARSFEHFVFGGILGDSPRKKRTKQELSKFMKNVQKRNIGMEQLSTDNAVYVVKQICEGRKFEEIKFIDSPEIIINNIESTILPFKYPIVNGKPNLPKELIKYLRRG